jgi:hypothetical protein
MSIIDFLCVLVLGYVIGNFHTIWKLRKLISDTATEHGLSETSSKTIHEIYMLEVETVGDTLYLYDADTKDFVCQGSSLTELAMLSKTYRNIMIAKVVHDDKVFMFVNGNYKEFNT